MYYPSIFCSGYLITMTALLQEEIKAWLYKLKIFNENPLFCLKINNNLGMFMFFNLQILWCSDFTFLPHNHWKLLLKILFLDWESCMDVYFFVFGIFFPLLNAHRIWYILSSSECSSYLVYFFLFWMLIEFGIFFPLLNAHRIWYLVHFFPLPNAQSFHWKTGYKIVLAMDFLTQCEIYND